MRLAIWAWTMLLLGLVLEAALIIYPVIVAHNKALEAIL